MLKPHIATYWCITRMMFTRTSPEGVDVGIASLGDALEVPLVLGPRGCVNNFNYVKEMNMILALLSCIDPMLTRALDMVMRH